MTCFLPCFNSNSWEYICMYFEYRHTWLCSHHIILTTGVIIQQPSMKRKACLIFIENTSEICLFAWVLFPSFIFHKSLVTTPPKALSSSLSSSSDRVGCFSWWIASWSTSCLSSVSKDLFLLQDVWGWMRQVSGSCRSYIITRCTWNRCHHEMYLEQVCQA